MRSLYGVIVLVAHRIGKKERVGKDNIRVPLRPAIYVRHRQSCMQQNRASQGRQNSSTCTAKSDSVHRH